MEYNNPKIFSHPMRIERNTKHINDFSNVILLTITNSFLDMYKQYSDKIDIYFNKIASLTKYNTISLSNTINPDEYLNNYLGIKCYGKERNPHFTVYSSEDLHKTFNKKQSEYIGDYIHFYFVFQYNSLNTFFKQELINNYQMYYSMLVYSFLDFLIDNNYDIKNK